MKNSFLNNIFNEKKKKSRNNFCCAGWRKKYVSNEILDEKDKETSRE